MNTLRNAIAVALLLIGGCVRCPPCQPCADRVAIDRLATWSMEHCSEYGVAIQRDAANERWRVDLFTSYHWGRDCGVVGHGQFSGFGDTIPNAADAAVGNYDLRKRE